MPDTTEQQELSTEEVVSLLNDDAPAATTRKGYEDYVKEAEAEAAVEDKSEADDKAGEQTTFNMPDKFQGKSAEEIAASYVELQSEYGRRNNEVGSLRKLTDQLLELKDTPETEGKPAKVTADSLLENPDDVINTAVDSNPRLKALEERLINSDRATAKEAFEEKHPDWEKTIHTPEFKEWVMESQLRQRLLTEADANYDYATGSELFDMYDLTKGNAIKDATDERNKIARKSAKQAVTETSGAAEQKGKPKYRRTELIQLKLSNPAKYEAMLPEIMAAYADKRVI